MDPFALLVVLLGACAVVLVLLVLALFRVLRSTHRRDAFDDDTDPRRGGLR
ncbi:hypothetical protein [Microbacterium sp. GXF7504]